LRRLPLNDVGEEPHCENRQGNASKTDKEQAVPQLNRVVTPECEMRCEFYGTPGRRD